AGARFWADAERLNGDITMRFKAWINRLAAALVLVSGCKERLFINEGDYRDYQNAMPANLEQNFAATASPTVGPVGAPPTVLNPERKLRYISLAECIAIALEQGTVGNQTGPLANITGNFIAVDTTAGGGGSAFSDNIR